MTRQVCNPYDGTENGIGLDPDVRNLRGSVPVPYIYEDHISNDKVADALMEVYDWGAEKREAVGKKAREYACSEFSLQKTVNKWDETLMDTIQNWKERYKKYHVVEV
jgi:hypothetical protein